MSISEKFANNYDRWFLTPQGLYIDEKEKELLISMFRFKTGDTLLEIGCGTGRYVEYFNDLGIITTGIEPDDNMFKIAKRKEKIKDKVIKGRAEELPFSDNYFDHVLFMTSFEFIEDKEKALKEAYRVSKSKIGIGFLNKFGITNYLRSKNKKNIYKEAKFFSEKELKKLIEKTLKKYKIIDVKYNLYLPLKFSYLLGFIDTILEKTNLPFGNFGVLIIKKE